MLRPMIKTIKALGENRFTTTFPEEKERQPDNYRGLHRLDIETCISCGACERICPNKTITMVDANTSKEEETPTNRPGEVPFLRPVRRGLPYTCSYTYQKL